MLEIRITRRRRRRRRRRGGGGRVDRKDRSKPLKMDPDTCSLNLVFVVSKISGQALQVSGGMVLFFLQIKNDAFIEASLLRHIHQDRGASQKQYGAFFKFASGLNWGRFDVF